MYVLDYNMNVCFKLKYDNRHHKQQVTDVRNDCLGLKDISGDDVIV